VLSHRPQWWCRQLDRFEAAAPARLRDPVPAPFRWMLWQTLVAAWPLQLPGAAARDAFAARIDAWAVKALREGKRYSSWTDPDAGLESAVHALVRHAAGPREGTRLHAALARAAAAVGVPGARLGLAQLALRLATPGVPDTYQGCEGWDLSLVDPDNRRPVDYRERRRWLDDPRDWQALLRDWRDGAVKARMLSAMLSLRSTSPSVFRGRYLPVALGADVVAFRRCGGRAALFVATLVREAAVVDDEGLRVPDAQWGDRVARLPAGHWRDVLGGAELLLPQPGEVSLSTLFARAPVAVWAAR
jgi:(1->4)-alpha-D-glucan 1-alpha-D-glucosylmutase